MLRPVLLISALALTACATTGKRRVVNVAAPTPVQTSDVRYDTPEAESACNTRKMRKRALDADSTNDIASVTVVREISPGRRTETDVDFNCREYLARRLGGSRVPAPQVFTAPEPTVIVTRAQTPITAPAPIVEVRTQTAALTHRVRRGDTLYDIARSYCTGWKTVADANGLRDASRIKPGQVLRIPGGGC